MFTGTPDIAGITFRISEVRTLVDIEAVTVLFNTYAASLDLDLAFQSFNTELSSMPGRYHPSQDGELLLARNQDNGEAIGCVALRRLSGRHSSEPVNSDGPPCPTQNAEPSVGEVKRLYVSPNARKTGLGIALASKIINIARGLGYDELKLDTLPSMAGAQKLYEKLGFIDIEPYCFNPVPGTRFLGLNLRNQAQET